jgi:non-specific serine/threonine protein kinase
MPVGEAAAPIPIRPARIIAHNLPAQFTSFVGREQDRAEVKLALGAQSRLVTLTGAGGVGKTRLAQEAAGDLLDRFRDGVWLVELASLSDATRVPHAVAATLGVHEEPGRAMDETLVAALRPRQALLVLDNCEQLLKACATLARQLLAGCPRVSILATSREPLGLPGETTWRVPSLDERDSTRLFTDRALAASPGFRALERSAAIGQICTRLDGIPLALELAAARVSAFDPTQIASRLDDRFRLLGGVSRAAPERQQTLRATIDWSYDLLEVRERRLFERLGAFGGGWSLEAAEAICGFDGLGQDDIADLLGRLVDKSLVIVEDAPYVGRWYRLLETVRAYARERLAASDCEAAVRTRHLDWYTEYTFRSDWTLRRDPDLPWEARRDCSCRITREMDNLRAAYRWAAEAGRLDQGMRLAAWLLPYFYTIGYLSEGREWLAQLLAASAAAPPSPARAQALSAATKLAAHHGDNATARSTGAEYLSLAATLKEQAWTADVLAGLAIVDTRQGVLDAAHREGLQAVALAESIGDPVDAAIYRTYAATAAHLAGRLEEASDLYTRSLIETRRLDFQLGVALALEGLGTVARSKGDLAEARSKYAEALSVFREMGALVPAMQTLIGSGYAALGQHDLGGARADFGEALDMALSVGQRQQVVNALDGLVLVAAGQECPERVLKMVAATELLRASGGSPAASEAVRSAIAEAREKVGAERADALQAEGAAMTLEQAIACAREFDAPLTMVRPAAPGGLTQREIEVVHLLGQGRSNREIADELVISVRTVERHVENVLGKLDLGSRSQVVVWAAQHGLLEA